MDYRTLLQKKDKMVQQAKAILDAAEDGKLSISQDDEYKSLKAKISQVNQEIAAAEEEIERERDPNLTPAVTPMSRSPFDVGDHGFIDDDASRVKKAKRAKDAKYGSSFGPVAGKTGGFRDLEEFLAVLSSGRFDPRLIKASMGEGSPSGGGFSVPEQFTAQWLDSSLENEIVRPRAQIWPMESETRKIPGFDSNDHSSALYGGLTASWANEHGEFTEVDAKLKLLTLTARKLGCFTRASNELVQDGLGFEAQLGRAIINTIGWYLDYAFLRGPGAGQPRGILNDPALITVAKETGQAADTILYENLTKMFARLAPQCLPNSVWIANSTCIPQLLSLSTAVGTGGSSVPVMNESSGVFRILTREVKFTEKLPAIGDAGDVILADLSQYAVGLRKEVGLEQSQHIGWLTDEMAYRAILRADGRGTWDKAITPKNGDSLSWCVALASR